MTTFIANESKIKPKGHLNCSITQPAKTDVPPRSLSLGDVLWGTSATQQQKFHTDDKICPEFGHEHWLEDGVFTFLLVKIYSGTINHS